MVKVWQNNKKIHLFESQEIEKAMTLVIELFEKENISLNGGMHAIQEILCRLLAAMGTQTIRDKILEEINNRIGELLNEE